MRGRIAAAVLAMAALPAGAHAQMFQPGMWSTTTTVTALSMPGAPPQVTDIMKRPHTMSHCVTPEEAARNPRTLLQPDKSCTFEHFNMGGGKLDMAMSCHQEGGTIHMQGSGSFTPTSYNATSQMTMSGGGHEMHMSSIISGKRIGACR